MSPDFFAFKIYSHLPVLQYIVKICILESRTSSFKVQSNDVKYFQADEKLSPLFSNTLKNYFRLSNNTASLIISPKM